MLYEVRVAADSDQEFADTLMKIVEAIKGLPANHQGFSFSRYQDHNNYDTVMATAQQTLASATNGTGEPVAAPVAAKRTGRPPKAAATATIVEGPDGEPAAAMEESSVSLGLSERAKRASEDTSPFGAPPPETPTTPAEKRERAIALLQSVFANPAGPPLVRALQTRLKVKKFNEVADAQVDELLAGAEKLVVQVQAAA